RTGPAWKGRGSQQVLGQFGHQRGDLLGLGAAVDEPGDLPTGGHHSDAFTVGGVGIVVLGLLGYVDGDAVVGGGRHGGVGGAPQPLEVGVEAFQPSAELLVGVAFRVGGDHDHVEGFTGLVLDLFQGEVELGHGQGAHVGAAGVTEVEQ